MRKRINRACVASSSNYVQSKRVHIALLRENHENNNSLFVMINNMEHKPLSDLERFELGLKRQIESFKSTVK